MTRSGNGLLLTAVIVVLGLPARAEAQERRWMADITAGKAIFIDDTPDHLFAAGGAVRRLITPRVSIGPELVVMTGTGKGDAFDRVLLFTGNVVFDVYSVQARTGRRVTPFLVGGLGWVWERSPLLTGSFWSNQPAFTAGGGIRARIGALVSAAAEYRVEGGLNQRFSGSLTFALS
jgi:hypothetical protein